VEGRPRTSSAAISETRDDSATTTGTVHHVLAIGRNDTNVPGIASLGMVPDCQRAWDTGADYVVAVIVA